MISRDVFAETLRELKTLKSAINHKVFLNEHFSAWNEYASETKQAWSKFPPKETPCGTRMEFRPEYNIAVDLAFMKREARLAALYKQAASAGQDFPIKEGV
jgi:hypothetical protein